MKKFSIYILFGLSILAFVALFDYVFSQITWRDQYRRIFAENVARLNDEALVAQGFYVARRNVGDRLG